MPVKRKTQRKDFRPDLDTLVRHQSEISDESVDPRYFQSSSSSSPTKSSKIQLRHYHLNARRTKIHLILDQKEKGKSPQKRKRRVSYFLMSQEYKRKMSDFVQLPESPEPLTRRKISWGQECEFVLFNKNKSCQAIRHAPRHKFSIDE